MGRVYQDSFGINSTTTNLNTYDTWAGATIGTTHVRSGTYALRVSSLTSATPQGALKKWISSTAAGPYYLRAYLFIVTLPSASNTIMNYNGASGTVGTTSRSAITLESNGTLILRDATGTQIGSASSAVNDSAWHMIELKIDNTPASGSRITEGRLDGSIFATSSTQTNGNPLAFSVGGNLVAEAQTTGEWWFDDIALNDTSGTTQTGYPGSGKVIYLWPNAAGDSNTFATQTGGTAGASNNYTRVDENPPDDATSFNGDNTLNDEDLFNVTNSGIGASDTINVVQVSGRFRNNTADATTAIKFEIEKTSGGTKSQSSAIVPNTTSWNTNATAVPRLPVITLYNDPDGSAWTQSTIDSAQIGYVISAGGTNRIDVTNIWMSVDYTPSAGGAALTISVSDSATTSESLNEIVVSYINVNEGPSFIPGTTSQVDTTEDFEGFGYSGSQRKIAVNGSGRLFVAYRKKFSTIYEPYVAYSDDQVTWTPVQVANIATDHQRVPSIFVDQSNVVHIVWYGKDPSNTGTNQRQIKYSHSTDNGATWSSWISVGGDVTGYTSSSLWQEHPDIFVDPTNASNLYVVWEGRDSTYTNAQQIKFSKSTDGGSTWAAWQNIYTDASNSSSRPAITITSDGRLHVTFYSTSTIVGGTEQIQHIYSSDGGTTWSSNLVVGNTSYDSRHVTIVTDGNNIHAAFRSNNATYATTQIFYSLFNGTSNTWSSPVAISPHANLYQFFPTIGLINSEPTVLWFETNLSSSYPSESPTTGLVYISRLHNGTWVPQQQLTISGTDMYPYINFNTLDTAYSTGAGPNYGIEYLSLATDNSVTTSETTSKLALALVSASDTTTTAESLSQVAVALISDTDSAITSENVSALEAYVVSVSDTSIVSDVVTITGLARVPLSDTATTSETITIEMDAFVSTYEATNTGTVALTNYFELVETTSNVPGTANTWITMTAAGMRFDAGAFDGNVTFYFEADIVQATNNGATASAQLYSVTDSAAVSGSALNAVYNQGYNQRQRSASISLSGDKIYSLQLKNTTTTTDTKIVGARIIVVQTGTITKTQLQINLGGAGSTSSTSTSNILSTSGQFLYTAAAYDGTVSVRHDSLIKATSGNTTSSGLYDITAGAAVSGSTNSTTNAGYTLVSSSSVSLTDGHVYSPTLYVSAGGSTDSSSYLVISITGGFTKYLNYIEVTNNWVNFFNFNTLQLNGGNESEPSFNIQNYTNAVASYYFEVDAKISDAAQTGSFYLAYPSSVANNLQPIIGSLATITGSTALQRTRSSVFQLPTGDNELGILVSSSSGSANVVVQWAYLVVALTNIGANPTDSVSAQISSSNALAIVASDSATTSETATVSLASFIATTESTTASDSASPTVTSTAITSDSTVASESVSISPQLRVNVSDTATIAEASPPNIKATTFISVADGITSAETVNPTVVFNVHREPSYYQDGPGIKVV